MAGTEGCCLPTGTAGAAPPRPRCPPWAPSAKASSSSRTASSLKLSTAQAPPTLPLRLPRFASVSSTWRLPSQLGAAILFSETMTTILVFGEQTLLGVVVYPVTSSQAPDLKRRYRWPCLPRLPGRNLFRPRALLTSHSLTKPAGPPEPLDQLLRSGIPHRDPLLPTWTE